MSTLNVNTINAATSGQGVAVDVQNPRSFRNLIINGAMQVNQRLGTSASSAHTSGSNANLCDRFNVYTNLTNYSATYQQVADAPAGSGLYYSQKITNGAAATYGASQEIVLRQKFEGSTWKNLEYGTSGAKTTTLSFWIKCSMTGTFSIVIYFGGASSADRYYVKNYTVSAANTWEKKTITITGLTEVISQVNYTNAYAGQIAWTFGTGSNYEGTDGSWGSSYKNGTSSDTNFFETNGATVQLTGIQWEIADYATSFEHRSYGSELARCQRYYQRWAGDHGGAYGISAGYTYASGTATATGLNLSTPLRAAPTVKNITNGGVLYGQGTSSSILSVAFTGYTLYSNWVAIGLNQVSDMGDSNHATTLANVNNQYIALEAEL